MQVHPPRGNSVGQSKSTRPSAQVLKDIKNDQICFIFWGQIFESHELHLKSRGVTGLVLQEDDLNKLAESNAHSSSNAEIISPLIYFQSIFCSRVVANAAY